MSDLVEAVLSNINLADTRELANAAELWKRGQAGLPVPVHKSSQK